MAQKVCYSCGARLANNQVSCKNCGAHQWRKGTDKMSVDKLKELADEEYRQGRLGTSEEHNRHMEKSMFLYSIIAEKIAYMAPKMEAIEPMERCIHVSMTTNALIRSMWFRCRNAVQVSWVMKEDRLVTENS